MILKTLSIQSIDDQMGDFEYLFDLLEIIKDNNYNATLDFSDCNFLRQNAFAVLGGIIRLAEENKGKIEILWKTFNTNLLNNLLKNGFLFTFSKFKFDYKPSVENSIPYREDKTKKPNDILKYLHQHWLGKGWINISPRLKDEISGKVWELYDNAFTHSGSPIGVISCGEHYPQNKTLKLTIVDFGISIPNGVRKFKNNQNLASDKIMLWAFQRGSSTKSEEIGRGLGLDLFKQFIKINRGHLEVFSLDGYASITKEEDRFTTYNKPFGGTLVNITFNCNESYYCLSSEKKSTQFTF